ncbi:alkaline phosphatase family protein [Jiulongibacter sp. NS-SX5]|uniref:alkaline phosphatase family protein n=1 Tax=Jiulongibacter sp. NS-SX5 TaxID=3463854 RepID=UPI004058E069
MRSLKTIFLILIFSVSLAAQKTENVILITLDGVRWQEVFKGADQRILHDEDYTENISSVERQFWNESAEVRREMLMPFLWTLIKEEGIIVGNRDLGSKVDIKNKYGFSYPGYNEILTGYPDEAVDSNDKNYNKNTTFLEYLNNQEKYKGSVAAFCTWDVFPYIINDKRSGLPVSAAGTFNTLTNTLEEKLLDEIEHTVPSLASGRFDFLTFYRAFDYLKTKSPKVLYIGFDETDEFAHEAKYREYLYAIDTIDSYIGQLWDYCQSHPDYKDKTTILITTDHGRGDADISQWTSHGSRVPDCGSIWYAVIGPDTPANGEINFDHQDHQNQIAATIAKLLGETFTNGHEIGKPLDLVVK